MSGSFPWRKAWKPRGAFAAVTPGCRAWYAILCSEIADDDGTVTLVNDGRDLRALTQEIGRRFGAPPGERRLLEGYLRTLLELELLVVDRDGKRLVIVQWEDEQETPKSPKKGSKKTPKPPSTQTSLPLELGTNRERTENEPQTNSERTQNEIEDKPAESLTTAREMRGDEMRGEESATRTREAPPPVEPSSEPGEHVLAGDPGDLSGARLRWLLERAVERATGTAPFLDHRRLQADELVRRLGPALLDEVEHFERWLTALEVAARPRDPWLRFCDGVGRWAELAAPPRRRGPVQPGSVEEFEREAVRLEAEGWA